MTRRSYLEGKLAKRQEWAGKAEARAEHGFTRVSQLANNIPLGQPILVGHHSERHARKDAARIFHGMSKAVADTKLAEYHEDKASGLERQLDHSIFSDDDNAIEALRARIAEREQEAEGYVNLNKAWRKSKGDPATFATLASISEATAQRIAHDIEQAYSWEKQPIPAYRLTNLRATIRKDQEHIKEINARAARAEQAETAGGTIIEGDEYVRVTYAEKPERTVIDALKTAGFRWSSGSWYGSRANLPAGIREEAQND